MVTIMLGIPPRFRGRMWQTMVELETRRFMQYPPWFLEE